MKPDCANFAVACMCGRSACKAAQMFANVCNRTGHSTAAPFPHLWYCTACWHKQHPNRSNLQHCYICCQFWSILHAAPLPALAHVLVPPALHTAAPRPRGCAGAGMLGLSPASMSIHDTVFYRLSLWRVTVTARLREPGLRPRKVGAHPRLTELWLNRHL